MRVWTGDPRMWGPGPDQGTAVTIGVFDGVHRGHQAVLAGVSARALESGSLETVVVTFDVHPRSLVTPAQAPKMLTTVEHRIELLESMGIDQVGVLPFTLIRPLQPEEFVRLVVDAFNVRAVTVGSGFRYGAGRAGNVSSLRQAGKIHGFLVEELELLEGEEGAISSSVIRRFIRDGDLAAAAVLLGRRHELRGVFRETGRQGSGSGFRTAGLQVDRSMAIPGPGVYAVSALVDGRTYRGSCEVLGRATHKGRDEVLEIHIPDPSGHLPGQEIAVRFIKRLAN